MKDVEMRKAALAGGPGRDRDIQHVDITEAVERFQADRIARLYAVSFATAATLARLAYAVAR